MKNNSKKGVRNKINFYTSNFGGRHQDGKSDGDQRAITLITSLSHIKKVHEKETKSHSEIQRSIFFNSHCCWQHNFREREPPADNIKCRHLLYPYGDCIRRNEHVTITLYRDFARAPQLQARHRFSSALENTNQLPESLPVHAVTG